MHRLLERQLKRLGYDDQWQASHKALLAQIDETYLAADRDRQIIERSLDLVSEELNQRNAELQQRLNQLQNTHNELQESLSTLNALFDATGEAVVTFDSDNQLLHFNQMAQDIFQLREEPLTAFHSIRLFRRLLKNDSEFLFRLRQLSTQPQQELFGLIEFEDHQLYEYHSAARLQNGEFLGRVWCFRNVTDIKASQAMVQHQAFHDSLTNLPNRLLLLDRLTQAIAFCNRHSTMCGVLFLDLDHFKKVNDTAGHQQGDNLLIEVANRIQSCLREHDTLARLGGDEFVILLENIDSHRLATRVARRITEVFREPFQLTGNQYFLSTSIGISIYPRDDNKPEELIRKADLAMYHAKAQGRNNFQYFNASLERIAHHQLNIENRLRAAIEEQAFELWYQPQVKANGKPIPRFEALIRWMPTSGPAVSPAEFIPVAEQTGLMQALGDWVLATAIAQAASWVRAGYQQLLVAINISAVQFAQKDFVQKIEQLLSRYQLPGRHIELEITETMLLEDMFLVRQHLSALKSLNISIAIDDFGTGYSSLKYLKELPIDILKIDRSFIQQLAEDGKKGSIVSAIISLAKSLDLEVVAEGVETRQTAEHLQKQGCHLLQGYYFCKPASVDTLEQTFFPSLSPCAK